VNRLWCVFFSVAAILAVVFFYIGPSMGWWFPGAAASPLGQQIDDLFYLILAITGVTFIGVHLVLGYILWKFGAVPGKKSHYQHGSHTLEVVWSIVPAGILLFIALYQMDVWAAYRIKSRFNQEALANPLAEVTARQFEWRIRYPAPGKVLQDTPQPDDLYTVNDLHTPAGKPVVIKLRSDDVLHSFFLPHLRVKQDAVPGLVIPVWFEASEPRVYDLVCAELCGWGHYKMRGQLTAQSQADFDSYIEKLKQSQNEDGYREAAAE
jgi:cytochrome c oxidase subunit 2